MDSGKVYILTESTPGNWIRDTNTINLINNGAGVWSLIEVDLSAYESQKIRIEFSLDTIPQSTGDFGWYIDDISITSVESVNITDSNYLENFEGGFNGWWVTNGIWETGTPTLNPAKAHSGTKIVTTILNGNYPSESISSDLVSPSFQLPTITSDQEINLRFWHYFELALTQDVIDTASVYISEQVSPGIWSIPQHFVDFINSGNSVWSQTQITLNQYQSKTVRLHFRLFTYEHSPTDSGWAIDDVSISVNNIPSVSNSNTVTENFENGINGWWATSGSWEYGLPIAGPSTPETNGHIVGTLLASNYNLNTNGSYLVSPTIKLPTITTTQELNLRFRHWFNFFSNADTGNVYVSEKLSENTWSNPVQLISFYKNGGNVWTQTQATVSQHQDKLVRFLFDVKVDNSSTGAPGWFLDDMEVGVDDVPIVAFANQNDQYIFEETMSKWWVTNGTWEVGIPTYGPSSTHLGSNAAGTI